jgi:hypothetical protein
MNAVVQHMLPGVPDTPLATPMQMLSIAVQRGVDTAQLEKLMDLHQRWEANEARKAFVTAMTAFKSEPSRIVKTKEVNIPGGAKFKHATLADVVDGVVSNLSKHGLSHRWVTEQVDRLVKVTCVITHESGHSESAEMSAPPDDSGKKNGIQQIGSTITYLQRYTLMAACGLAASDMQDDDGRGHGAPKKPQEPAGYENWAADMEALADEGSARLQEAWKGSKDEFRRYAVKYDDVWWQTMKTRSAKAVP